LGCAMIFLAVLVPLAVRYVLESQLLNRYSRKVFY